MVMLISNERGGRALPFPLSFPPAARAGLKSRCHKSWMEREPAAAPFLPLWEREVGVKDFFMLHAYREGGGLI